MIKFNGKDQIIDCMDQIAAAGHWLRRVDDVVQTSDDAAVQAIVDAYTLSDAKAWKSKQVSAHAKALRDTVTSYASPGEMASWPIKRDEAQAYTQDKTSQTPLLGAEAAARGVSVDVLVARVNANSAMFSALEAAIGGTDGKHRDAIAALTTFEEVASYDFSGGWPGV